MTSQLQIRLSDAEHVVSIYKLRIPLVVRLSDSDIVQQQSYLVS